MTTAIRKPILCDVDGVVADFIGKCLKYVNDRDGSSITHADIKNDIRLYPFWGDDCDAFVRSPGFCRDLNPIPEGFKAVEQLRAMGEKILFVTSPFGKAPTWCHDRQLWLESYFGVDRDDVIFARSKEFIDGKMMIDDLYKNIVHWERYWLDSNKLALMFNQPWNETTPYDPYEYNRVSTADEIMEKVKRFSNVHT